MRRLIIYSVANILNFTLWLGILFASTKKLHIVFLYLTILSYTFSIIYLFIMWIYEIRLHLNKHNTIKHQMIKECKFYNTMRERVFKYAFLINLTVCIGYWGLCLGGENIMKTNINTFVNIYVHGLIGVQMLIELLMTDRKHLPHLFLKDYFISATIIAVYSVLLVAVAKTYDIYIYPFLRLEVTQITAINLVLFLISFNVYQFFHYVLEKKESRGGEKINFKISRIESTQEKSLISSGKALLN
jgi:hypothetical protein